MFEDNRQHQVIFGFALIVGMIIYVLYRFSIITNEMILNFIFAVASLGVLALLFFLARLFIGHIVSTKLDLFEAHMNKNFANHEHALNYKLKQMQESIKDHFDRSNTKFNQLEVKLTKFTRAPEQIEQTALQDFI